MSGYTKDVCMRALELGGVLVADGAGCLYDIEKDATRADWVKFDGGLKANVKLAKSVHGYKMERNHCHKNAAVIARAKGWEMWSGLALSDDGIWRVHSWCVAKKNGRGTGRVYETTLHRVMYYGVKQSAAVIEDELGGF